MRAMPRVGLVLKRIINQCFQAACSVAHLQPLCQDILWGLGFGVSPHGIVILPNDPHLVLLSLYHPLPFPRARDLFCETRYPWLKPWAIIVRLYEVMNSRQM